MTTKKRIGTKHEYTEEMRKKWSSSIASRVERESIEVEYFTNLSRN